MYEGMKPYDFVQQVYYAQEKVLLDFVPSDDKYREVLVEANFVLQDLQSTQDWTWLREQIVLGPCNHLPGTVLEFTLPSTAYKLSGLNHDCLRLYRTAPEGSLHSFEIGEYTLNAMSYINVPISSSGDTKYLREIPVTRSGGVHWPDWRLRAINHGNKIIFNRELTDYEKELVAVTYIQKKIPLLHVCDETCRTAAGNTNFNYEVTQSHDFVTPCSRIESKILDLIPDPNYIVMATAAKHAEGSPPALSRVSGLQDAAQRILSSMRNNDSEATDSDYQDWDTPGYVAVY